MNSRKPVVRTGGERLQVVSCITISRDGRLEDNIPIALLLSLCWNLDITGRTGGLLCELCYTYSQSLLGENFPLVSGTIVII